MNFYISQFDRHSVPLPAQYQTLADAIDAAHRQSIELKRAMFVFHVLWKEPKAIAVDGTIFRSVEWCVEEACRAASVAIRGTLR